MREKAEREGRRRIKTDTEKEKEGGTKLNVNCHDGAICVLV
mgnify:CR=1 FL=1